MKKTLTLIILLSAILPLSAKSVVNNVRYALPRTVITLEVKVKEQSLLAGPCAGYAQDLLGLDVPEHDTTTFNISSITLSTSTEADYGRIISYNPKEEAKVQQLCEQGLLYLGPLKVSENKSTTEFPVRKLNHRTEKGLIEAKMAAEKIESYRQDIYNITIGNTDAAYQGEAMSAAIAELHARESEHLKLFTPRRENLEHSLKFSFVPEQEDSSAVCINAFRFSPEKGVLSEYSNKGELYTIEIEADPYFAEETALPDEKQVALEYRLPVLCTIKLVHKGNVVCSLRAPIYQLGIKEKLFLQK